jgi:hypothetical protein
MNVELIREKAKIFPFDRCVGATSLKVWFCGYSSLEQVGNLEGLKQLVVAGYPDVSLEPLARLRELEELELHHIPKVTSLEPLRELSRLRSLSLGTLPGWDASRKRTRVESLSPLTALQLLERIELLGVVPLNQSLGELRACRSVKNGRFLGYPASEVQALQDALPLFEGS